MEGFFERFGIVDLALGKPGTFGLPITATVGDALRVLRELKLTEVSVWECTSGGGASSRKRDSRDCYCVGKVGLLDIICYYAQEDKVRDLSSAAKEPVSVLLRPSSRQEVRQVDSNFSAIGTRDGENWLTEAFDSVLDGAQCLLVPLPTRRSKSIKGGTSAARKPAEVDKLRLMDYCCLTHEDILRFLLNCICRFGAITLLTIEELGIINRDVLYVDVNSNAKEAISLMRHASAQMTAVAVVEEEELGVRKLVADISAASFKNYDESAALALATLSVSDFVNYVQDSGNGFESLKHFMLAGLERIDSVSSEDSSMDSSESDMWDSSSDEVSSTGSSHRENKSHGWCTSTLTCHPWNSLAAVMVQALAHRTSYLWVTDSDHSLIGMITYIDMISVLLSHLE